MTQFSKAYDLEIRTVQFGAGIIVLCKGLPQSNISSSLVNQLVRSATSIGANYMEANGASSKKDFRNKIYICKKEAQETKYWLKMILSYYPDKESEIVAWLQEVHELVLIFQKIVFTLDHSKIK
jgi:four helix bundle protein